MSVCKAVKRLLPEAGRPHLLERVKLLPPLHINLRGVCLISNRDKFILTFMSILASGYGACWECERTYLEMKDSWEYVRPVLGCRQETVLHLEGLGERRKSPQHETFTLHYIWTALTGYLGSRMSDRRGRRRVGTEGFFTSLVGNIFLHGSFEHLWGDTHQQWPIKRSNLQRARIGISF